MRGGQRLCNVFLSGRVACILSRRSSAYPVVLRSAQPGLKSEGDGSWVSAMRRAAALVALASVAACLLLAVRRCQGV